MKIVDVSAALRVDSEAKVKVRRALMRRAVDGYRERP